MRLIDADRLRNIAISNRDVEMVYEIDHSPTVERPHGEWIEREVRNIFGETMKAYECSICKRKNIGDVWIMMELPFCPNCGSDNRKRKGDEKWKK